MAIITKELALKIAKKLKANVVSRTKAHDIALVNHEGKIVAQFAIRRGSRKELGHDHIPEQIFLRPKQARELGQCPISREDWIKIIVSVQAVLAKLPAVFINGGAGMRSK